MQFFNVEAQIAPYPRYHSAARPVMLIVTVYGSAMITMRP
jgi:hypothetical protein